MTRRREGWCFDQHHRQRQGAVNMTRTPYAHVAESGSPARVAESVPCFHASTLSAHVRRKARARCTRSRRQGPAAAQRRGGNRGHDSETAGAVKVCSITCLLKLPNLDNVYFQTTRQVSSIMHEPTGTTTVTTKTVRRTRDSRWFRSVRASSSRGLVALLGRLPMGGREVLDVLRHHVKLACVYFRGSLRWRGGLEA